MQRIRSDAVPTTLKKSSEEDLDAPAATRVCRICLAIDTKMYTITEYKLDIMFQEITGLVGWSERLPQRVCWECAARLSSAYQFREKALRSDGVLKELIQPYTYIKVRDVQQVNRTENKLTSNLIQQIYGTDDFDLHIQDSDIIHIEKLSFQEIIDNLPAGDVQMMELPPKLKKKITADPVENIDNLPTDSENDMDKASITSVESTDSLPTKFIEIGDSNLPSSGDEINHDVSSKEHDEIDNEDVQVLSKVSVDDKTSLPEKNKNVKLVNKRSKEDDVQTNGSSPANAPVNPNYDRRKSNIDLDKALFTVTPLTCDEQIEEVKRRQHSRNYTTSLYKCDICYRGFSFEETYAAHAVRHTEQCGTFECYVCRIRFKTKKRLRNHLTAQHTARYSCNMCSFISKSRGTAREHQKWHAGLKYQCPHCPSEFNKFTSYLGHIRIKHVSDIACELCGYMFVSKQGVEVHKRKKHILDINMTLEGPYCQICDVKFASEEAHDRHLKLSARHSNEHGSRPPRNDCQTGYISTSKHLKSDMRTRRPHNDNPVNCEQCGQQLRNLKVYAQHFRRFHPDKVRTKYSSAMKTPCMCEQCGMIFLNKVNLQYHSWVHTGVKRFKCDKCPKSFSQKTNLAKHLKLHGGFRDSYECPLCGKHFPSSNNRNRHLFIHTGLKPFKCDACDKSFTTYGGLKSHIDHIHDNVPWPKRTRQRGTKKQADDTEIED